MRRPTREQRAALQNGHKGKVHLLHIPDVPDAAVAGAGPSRLPSAPGQRRVTEGKKRYALRVQKVEQQERDKFRALSMPDTYYEIKPGVEVGEQAAYSVEMTEEEAEKALADVGKSNLLSVEEVKGALPCSTARSPGVGVMRYHRANHANSLGLTGAGIKIGSIDTGVSSEIANFLGGKIVAARGFEGIEPLDYCGPYAVYPQAHGCWMTPLACPPSARIAIAAVATSAGILQYDSMAAAFYWLAEDVGVDIIYVETTLIDDSYVQDAINAANAAGCLVLGAVGNDSTNLSAYWPSGALGISAFDHETDAPASYTNFGSNVWAAAGGHNAVCINPDGVTAIVPPGGGGTSASVAIAAELCARRMTGGKSAATVKTLMERMARQTPSAAAYDGHGVLRLPAVHTNPDKNEWPRDNEGRAITVPNPWGNPDDDPDPSGVPENSPQDTDPDDIGSSLGGRFPPGDQEEPSECQQELQELVDALNASPTAATSDALQAFVENDLGTTLEEAFSDAWTRAYSGQGEQTISFGACDGLTVTLDLNRVATGTTVEATQHVGLDGMFNFDLEFQTYDSGFGEACKASAIECHYADPFHGDMCTGCHYPPGMPLKRRADDEPTYPKGEMFIEQKRAQTILQVDQPEIVVPQFPSTGNPIRLVFPQGYEYSYPYMTRLRLEREESASEAYQELSVQPGPWVMCGVDIRRDPGSPGTSYPGPAIDSTTDAPLEENDGWHFDHYVRWYIDTYFQLQPPFDRRTAMQNGLGFVSFEELEAQVRDLILRNPPEANFGTNRPTFTQNISNQSVFRGWARYWWFYIDETSYWNVPGGHIPGRGVKYDDRFEANVHYTGSLYEDMYIWSTNLYERLTGAIARDTGWFQDHPDHAYVGADELGDYYDLENFNSEYSVTEPHWGIADQYHRIGYQFDTGDWHRIEPGSGTVTTYDMRIVAASVAGEDGGPIREDGEQDGRPPDLDPNPVPVGGGGCRTTLGGTSSCDFDLPPLPDPPMPGDTIDFPDFPPMPVIDSNFPDFPNFPCNFPDFGNRGPCAGGGGGPGGRGREGQKPDRQHVRVGGPFFGKRGRTFARKRCYKNASAMHVIKQLCNELDINPDAVVFDYECHKNFTRCFRKGSSKFDAIWWLADLCGFEPFDPGDGTPTIGDPTCPKGRTWTFHEDIDLFELNRDYSGDGYDVVYAVEVWRARSTKNGIVIPAFSVISFTGTPFSTDTDNIKMIEVGPSVNEAEAEVIAKKEARKSRMLSYQVQVTVPYNPAYRLRNRARIERPSKGFSEEFMVTGMESDLSDEGFLHILSLAVIHEDCA